MKNYGILSIIFLLLSLAGGIYLVNNNQDNRKQAECLRDSRCGNRCDEVFCAGCINGCRHISDKTCGQLVAEECGPVDNKWTNCESVSGITVSGKCVSASNLDAALSKCPNSFPSNGCNDPNFVKNTGSTICFEDNFCGSQQIDVFTPSSCWVHFEDHQSCVTPTPPPQNTPTSTPKPTSTIKPSVTPTATSTPKPTSTIKPSVTPTATSTPKPTSTIKPSVTPTNEPTSTLIPTPTNGPTSTPAPTDAPTSTPTNIPPTPTDVYIAEGPSPTRIILPQSGVEFPAQMLTIFGGIVTLLGFLILL